jgi:hypothetical protein
MVQGLKGHRASRGCFLSKYKGDIFAFLWLMVVLKSYLCEKKIRKIHGTF